MLSDRATSASNDTPTAGYNLLKMELSHRKFFRDSPWGATEITTGLVGDNLLDVDVRNSRAVPQGRNPAAGTQHQILHERQVRRQRAGSTARLFQGSAKLRPVNGYGPLPLFKAPVLTAWTWAGPYVGANIGYSAGRSRTDAAFVDAATGASLFAVDTSDNLDGLIGGIQTGYNWQWGNWIAGIEADLQISGQGATPSYVCPGAVCNAALVGFDAPVTASFDQGPKLDSFGTLRATLRHDA